MSEFVQDLLKSVGWDNAFAIPVANDKNKVLINEYEEILRKKCSITDEVNSLRNRVERMQNHSVNINQEITEVSEMYQARCQDFETENNLFHIAEREHERIKKELAQTKNKLNKTRERKQVLQNTVFQKKMKIQSLKEGLNVDTQMLEAWLKENEETSDDIYAFNTFMKQDDGILKELSLELSKLTSKKREQLRVLDKAVIDGQTNEVSCEKLAGELRQAMKERNDMLDQWEKSMQHCSAKEKETESLSQCYSDLVTQIDANRGLCREKNDFLNSMTQTNSELERRVAQLDRTRCRLSLAKSDAVKELNDTIADVKGLACAVERENANLENTRSEIAQLKKSIIVKHEKISEIANQVKLLKERLNLIAESKLTAEQMNAEAQRQLQGEEENQKRLHRLIDLLSKEQFTVIQELRVANEEKKTLEATIVSNSAAVRNLDSRCDKMNEQNIRRHENMYNLDFAINKVEERVNRMEGELHVDQRAKLETSIASLTLEFEKLVENEKLMAVQLKLVQDEVRRYSRSIETLSTEASDLKYRLRTEELSVEQTEKALRQAEVDHSELLVDKNMLRLKLTRMARQLENHTLQVVGLEKNLLQLKAIAKEREMEINIQKDLITEELRMIAEEKTAINKKLQMKKTHTIKLMNRFEIASIKFAPPENQEFHGQAYYTIKAAQEKDELHQVGDALDADIEQSMKELEALQNTVSLMKGCNRVYLDSHTDLPEDSELRRNYQALEEQHKSMTLEAATKRRCKAELVIQKQKLLTALKSADERIENSAQYQANLAERSIYGQRDAQLLEEKLQRATKCVTKAQAAIRKSATFDQAVFNEMEEDINIQLSQELTKKLVTLMFSCLKATGNMEIDEQARTYCSAAGIITSDRFTRRSVSSTSLSSISNVSSSRISLDGSSKSSSTRSFVGARSVDMSQSVIFPGEHSSQIGSGRASQCSSLSNGSTSKLSPTGSSK